MREIYNINPVAKPRMTQRDKWKKRPCVLGYYAFKDDCRLHKVRVPACNSHIIFVIPMPKSWPKKKKAKFVNKAHQQKPDKDNLEKSLLDAVYGEDCVVWDNRVTKIWGDVGRIIICDIYPGNDLFYIEGLKWPKIIQFA
ncbi:MAG: RusA family crossover junction endodeoxyribonuclease [Betaproteobacteria bacterium]|nr:MAG: RusA family crossover junction endodeoxyribonuclease [Betaproteobacteria bacterium]